MKSASMGPIWVCSRAMGQLMRISPQGSARVISMAACAASASTSIALQCS